MEAFKFPHERENETKAEAEDKVEFEVEGETPEVEVVDDTPEQDRNRRPMTEPPKDVTDEELAKYDEKVRQRIQHFNKGYHEERRAKEAAQREKDEALRLAQTILEENKKLKGSLGQNQQILLDQAKKNVATDLSEAKRKLKEAHDAFDSDAIAEAQAALTAATIRAERISNMRPPVQRTENDVQIAQQPVPQPAAPDSRAVEWQNNNRWFGKDEEMTSFALGVHTKLVNEGVDPTSDEYYDTLNKRLRKVFPEQFEPEEPVDAPPPRKKSNVAPATRSTAPRKIVLTQTQVNIAKRLGVPLELYAKKVAEEMRK